MSEAPFTVAESTGRLGNVSAAVLLGGIAGGLDPAARHGPGADAVARAAGLLDRLFDETLLVGGAPAPAVPGRRVPEQSPPRSLLHATVTALEASSHDRVLVLSSERAPIGADLLLALTAWPEADAVFPAATEGAESQGGVVPPCAVYRRDLCLAAARAELASKSAPTGNWLGGLVVARLSMAALGLEAADQGIAETAGPGQDPSSEAR